MNRNISIQDAALGVVRRLRENGHEALWAGGCVRDMLLGLEPADIDVATDAHPDRIVELFRRTRKVGMQFGVVLVQQGSLWIETATFRSDVNYTDGRHPESVVFTTAEQDAQRRDFTINGLFYDPIDQRVIDYVNGQADLKACLIRAIGEPVHRFQEDHLRLLRAVRFASRFDFQIEPATAQAIREQAEAITRISAERIREELEKMLARPSRVKAVTMLAELGLLPFIVSVAPCDSRAIQRLTALPPTADFVLSMAAILEEFSHEQVHEVTRGLRCSNYQIAEISWLVQQSRKLDHAETMPLAAFKRLLAQPRFDDLLALHDAVCATEHRPPSEAARIRRRAIPPAEIAPPPLIVGEDLLELGIPAGPIYKAILHKLYDAQLNQELTDRQQAYERLLQLIKDRS